MRLQAVVALLFSVALLASIVAAYGTFFFDSFNDRDISDWSITKNGIDSFVYVSPIFSKEGAGSLTFNSTKGVEKTAYANSPAINFSSLGAYNVSFYFMIPNVEPIAGHWFTIFDNGFADLIWDNGAASKQYMIFCDEGSGSYKSVSQKMESGKWYNVELEVHPETSSYFVYFDGQFQRICGQKSSHTNGFVVGDVSPNAADFGEAYWDFFEVKIPVDIEGPQINVLSPAQTNQTNLSAQITLNEIVSSCTASFDGAASQIMTQGATARDWSVNFNSVSEGPHSLKFSCIDLSANSREKTFSFSVDSTKPSITLLSPSRFYYPEDFVWVNATTNENSACAYSLNETAGVYLDTADSKNFFKKSSSLSGAYNVSVSCYDLFGNSESTAKKIFFAGMQKIFFDVDGDSNSETAENSDGNFLNGFENYTDADASSNLYSTTDGDSDGEIDFLINTTGGPEPEVYWDTDNNITSVVSLIDVNSDGTNDFVFDSDGDGTNDKWYNPKDSAVGNYAPPQPPTPPNNPSGNTPSNSPGACCGGSGVITTPLKEDLYFINPPSTIFATAGNETEFELTLSNTGNKKTKISFKFLGAPAEWFSVSNSGSNISSGKSETYKIKFTPPETGSYDVNLSVEGAETVISLPMKLVVEEQKIAAATTTTSLPNTTTTTTIPPSGITGAILFLTNNPLVSGAAAVILVVGGSILWSMRKPTVPSASKTEEEKIAEQQEAQEKN